MLFCTSRQFFFIHFIIKIESRPNEDSHAWSWYTSIYQFHFSIFLAAMLRHREQVFPFFSYLDWSTDTFRAISMRLFLTGDWRVSKAKQVVFLGLKIKYDIYLCNLKSEWRRLWLWFCIFMVIAWNKTIELCSFFIFWAAVYLRATNATIKLM